MLTCAGEESKVVGAHGRRVCSQAQARCKSPMEKPTGQLRTRR